MQPNQPTGNGIPQPPTPPAGQYDFIIGNKSPRSDWFRLPTPSSTGGRIIIAGGGGLVLLIIAIIFMAVLSSSGKIDTGPLIALAQRQTELVRVSRLAVTSSAAQPTQDFAMTTTLALTSLQHDLLAYLHRHGTDLSSDVLTATKDKRTDTAFNNAATSGNFDQTAIATLQTQLAGYERSLQQAYAATSLKSERDILKASFNQAQLLTAMSTQSE